MWYVADFETTSYQYYTKKGYTKVWLYSVCNENGDIINEGNNIEDFIKWCKSISDSYPIIYFHNLKFDGSFIIDYLLRHEYYYFDKLTKKSNKGFSTLIGEEGEWYQIKLNFARHKQVTFRDSLKLIPLKVKEMGEAFGFNMEKEKIDYEDYTINETTLSYIHKDVQIVAKALSFFISQGLDKVTIGSNSYNIFKESFPFFEDYFPSLDLKFLTEYRDAYRGGRSQVNPLFENKILHNVKRFDINSMYPYVMYSQELPYGEPISLKKMGLFKFELYKVEIGFNLLKGHLPTLLKKGSMFQNATDTYYHNSDGIEIIYISNIDLEILKRHYEIYYFKLIEGYGFRTTTIMFRPFIDKYYKLKNESKGGLRLVYKLILNNLYGKFGSRCLGKTKIPKLDGLEVKFENSEEQEMLHYYLPLAIAITSYAHLLIDNAIMATGYDKFVYCDTDSVHTLGTLPIELIDNKELGKFKLEGVEDTCKYVRQKCYIYKQDDKWDITCAGMTIELKDYLVKKYKDNVINEFKLGLKIDEESEDIRTEDLKKRPLRVVGGIVLKPVPFSLR